MPKAPMPVGVLEFLTLPNPATITTVRPDGQPVSVATWYLLDGEQILVNMADTRIRLDYLRKDPRVSLTVLAIDAWQNHVSVQGRAVRLEHDVDFSGIDRLCRHYRGYPYPNREVPRVNAWIDVVFWHAWNIPTE